jgi:UDP-2,3-diacylglucosamine pyrophosphatase LpxH
MSDLPAFDEIHVVSDLHMGGKPGFQILRETTRLANHVRWVASQRSAGRVALVLNGDVIDTLAEDIAGYVAVDDAVSTVQRIMGDPAFGKVWDALADFVKKDGRTLVIVIGNHDIELAFPSVQRLIMSRLAGENLAARARVEFSTAGAGYPCVVGDARIFCTHGNETDAWNYVRYEDLSKVARRLNCGRSLDASEWEPNAGTKMVKDIMNDVKRKYAWIDLLKPETSAAVGALLVLDPSQAAKFDRLLPIVGERARGNREMASRLSTEGFRAAGRPMAPAASVDQLLGPNLRQAIGARASGGERDAGEMLRDGKRDFARPGVPTQPLPAGTLGTGQLVWDRFIGWLTGVSQDEALRRALKDWLEGDNTFDRGARDDTFKQVTESVGPNVDFIVTGHTHLERAIDMSAGRYYFNCGTWIRLLRLTDAMLKDTASFKPVYEVLLSGRMEAIDGAKFGDESLVLDQSGAVSVKREGSTVVGRLTHVEGDGTGAPRVIQEFARP